MRTKKIIPSIVALDKQSTENLTSTSKSDSSAEVETYLLQNPPRLSVNVCGSLKAKFHYASWFEAGSKLVGGQH